MGFADVFAKFKANCLTDFEMRASFCCPTFPNLVPVGKSKLGRWRRRPDADRDDAAKRWLLRPKLGREGTFAAAAAPYSATFAAQSYVSVGVVSAVAVRSLLWILLSWSAPKHRARGVAAASFFVLQHWAFWSWLRIRTVGDKKVSDLAPVNWQSLALAAIRVLEQPKQIFSTQDWNNVSLNEHLRKPITHTYIHLDIVV